MKRLRYFLASSLALLTLASCTLKIGSSSAGVSSTSLSDTVVSTTGDATSSTSTSSSDGTSALTGTSSSEGTSVSSEETVSSSSAAESSASSSAGSSSAATSASSTAVSSASLNYAPSASRYNYHDLQASSETPVLSSTGSQKILVIPVKIRDASGQTTSYAANASTANKARIEKAFFGTSADTSWESLASYYEKSSYGQLKLSGKVSDWFDCGYTADQLSALKGSGDTADYYDPTWTVLEKAVAWYKQNNSDIGDFDNDKDGILDGVWLVYSAPNCTNNTRYFQSDALKNLFWAYTYWDYDVTDRLNAEDPLAVIYCWASFDFMNEGYTSGGIDAHTFIHETGHLLGLDDYYVASSQENTSNYGPMGGVDMMDYNIIDHNAFSKFALGWVTPYVVQGECSLTLKPSSSSGECVLIPTGDGWNGSAFDEYLLLEYYTPTDLNAKDAANPYTSGIQGFTENGVRIYHVDARMAKCGSQGFVSYTDSLVSDSRYYTACAHSNSNDYNLTDINDRLIQEMDCTNKKNFDTDSDNGGAIIADDSTLFQQNNSFSLSLYSHSFPKKTTMNDGTAFADKISFGPQNASGASLTISRA